MLHGVDVEKSQKLYLLTCESKHLYAMQAVGCTLKTNIIFVML